VATREMGHPLQWWLIAGLLVVGMLLARCDGAPGVSSAAPVAEEVSA
jgi:hypothetical protein